MNEFTGLLLFLAASIVSVPTPPGVPSADVTARHGTVYQTANDTKVTLGFMEINNNGQADELTAADCPLAGMTSIVDANGKKLASVPIPAGQTSFLTASGTHLILQNLHFAVQYGSIIPCSLEFAVAGTVSVSLYAMSAP